MIVAKRTINNFMTPEKREKRRGGKMQLYLFTGVSGLSIFKVRVR
jgi:hypothetical protein